MIKLSGIIIKYPLIIVNLKSYKEGMSDRAVELIRIAERVNEKTGISVAIAPQVVDLQTVAECGKTPIFAQHLDLANYGKYTGYILPESVAEAGAIGTLINHSERQLPLNTIKATVKRAREADLITVVCVDTIEKARKIAAYSPDSIAIEPPELIGSGISVSTAQPEIISGSIGAVKGVNPKIKVLCGAGITTGNDVSAAMNLGAEGILVASGVVKSINPYSSLLELARAMQRYSA
jgi:triosephosphate isomerase